MAKLATFQDPIFQDETKAREALEGVLWPDGPYCRHCGNSDQDKIAKMQGKSARPGLYYCNECKGQFTVTVGTVFERSKVPLTKWWLATHLFNQGKNGASAHEIGCDQAGRTAIGNSSPLAIQTGYSSEFPM